MKFFCLLFLWMNGLFFIRQAEAQKQLSLCLFDEYAKNHINPQTEYIIQRGKQHLLSYKKTDTSALEVKTVPVVVHVIHNGGSENISDTQIQNAITVLNEDYRKIAGTNGDGGGVDTQIQFRLARISPKGNCTNGIVRIQSTLTSHYAYQRLLLKELNFWDNTRYLNIYVVKNIYGAPSGYSSYPGGSPDEDGIVIEHSSFGNTGTASGSGRTLTHEVGHWLGLYHTFNNGCGADTCSDGDYVCDTPPTANQNYECDSVNSCSNDVPDVYDQIQNYMDYSKCRNMFTSGQKLRMHSTLNTIRTKIWSDSNLIATGCDTNYVMPSVCPVIADFVALISEICTANSVNFTNRSLNETVKWKWFFIGGTPDTSTQQNPTVTYNSVGKYPVTFIAADSNFSDTITIPDYIVVSNPGTGDTLPFWDDFETVDFPSHGITINNHDNGVTWQLDSAASYSGRYSVKINNLINTNYGTSDEIILPYFDLTSITTYPYLKFEWAYAKSDVNVSDELIVLVSKDCGNSFKQVFYKTGDMLATGVTQTTPFVPSVNEWKKASIYLGTFTKEPYLMIKIVNVTDGGNNLYIDNIRVGDISLSVSEVKDNSFLNVYPNPNDGNFELEILNYELRFKNAELRIYNVLGEKVYQQTLNTKQKTLNTKFSKGVYFLQVITEEGVWTNKIIVND